MGMSGSGSGQGGQSSQGQPGVQTNPVAGQIPLPQSGGPHPYNPTPPLGQANSFGQAPMTLGDLQGKFNGMPPMQQFLMSLMAKRRGIDPLQATQNMAWLHQRHNGGM